MFIDLARGGRDHAAALGPIGVLRHHRMQCVGCLLARFCTLEEGCRSQSTSLRAVLRDLAQAGGGRAGAPREPAVRSFGRGGGGAPPEAGHEATHDPRRREPQRAPQGLGEAALAAAAEGASWRAVGAGRAALPRRDPPRQLLSLAQSL